jgi:hypothetical protein
MQVRGSLSFLFRNGLRRDFRDKYREFPVQYPMYLKTGRADGPEVEATIITGMSRLREIGDGEPVQYEPIVLGPKVVGVDREFGLGFMLTRKTVEDDKYGKANQGAKWLANASRKTSEYRSGQLLDDAFAGTDFKGIDGKSLLNTAHDLLNPQPAGPTTYANQPATQFGFGLAGIEALLELHELMVDHNGDPIVTSPNLVIYNPSQISKAIKIFDSSREPFTSDNQDNAIPKRLSGVQHFVKRFTSNKLTYMLVDKELNDCHYLTRRAVSFLSEDDFDTRAMKNRVDTRFIIWFVDNRGWTGANPTS